MSYAAHRQERIRLADNYAGWDRPPYPFQSPAGHCVGRVVMTRTVAMDHWFMPGIYPLQADWEALFKAKEKRQNRIKF